MTIRGVHHVQITIPVGAEDEGRAFYCDLLGLVEIPKPDSLSARGGFWVLAGECELHIGTEPDVERSATNAHIAYEVDDLEAWRERLTAGGVAVVDEVAIPGYRRFKLRDPFGNQLELIQRV